MLNRFARALFTRLLTPIANALLRLGISPDVVTIVGTLGVCVVALAFYPGRISSSRISPPTRAAASRAPSPATSSATSWCASSYVELTVSGGEMNGARPAGSSRCSETLQPLSGERRLQLPVQSSRLTVIG